MGSDPLGYAVFSPDSTKVAFLRITYPYPNNAEVDDLFVANADGSSPRAIESRAFSNTPIWSPSGRALAVYRMEEMGPDQLTLAFLDGSPRQVVAEAMVPAFWLP
jgi:Tol biopolymer transport system component